jgi:uncharacterized damage-inducible protein DinB
MDTLTTPTSSPARPHAQRLRSDLDDTHTELLHMLQTFTSEELDWSPRPDLNMKSYKQILQEIGTMEKITCYMAQHQEELDWNTVWQALDANDVTTLLSGLAAIRGETLAFLDACTEEQLQTPIPLNAEWQGYLHVAAIEPEELLRWIVRHEYYHLGQLVIYQWQRDNLPKDRN